MAFLLNKTCLSHRLHSQVSRNSFALLRRGIHAQDGAREKTLLAEDPALRRFKSPNKGVQILKRISDVLTIVVVAGCCYEVYTFNKAREQATKSA